jgi:excisionase family DNA binding protein
LVPDTEAPPVTGSQTIENLPDLMTVEEYAAFARRGKNQAYEDVRQGRVPSMRLGKAIRIPKAALLRMLAGEAADAVA